MVVAKGGGGGAESGNRAEPVRLGLTRVVSDRFSSLFFLSSLSLSHSCMYDWGSPTKEIPDRRGGPTRRRHDSRDQDLAR